MNLKHYFNAWFKWLAYNPEDFPKIAPKIVVIGGGTGLSKLLQGLKEFSHNLTAIVTVFDSGGSAGRLRKDFNIPALGDVRNCLVALAEQEDLMRVLFDYRFENGKALKGHSLGNILLTAILQQTKDLNKATHIASSVLRIQGKVIPSSLGNAQLKAKLSSGKRVKGEDKIPEQATKTHSKIKKIWLCPPQKTHFQV